jgi:hypothetical protein
MIFFVNFFIRLQKYKNICNKLLLTKSLKLFMFLTTINHIYLIYSYDN